MIAMPPRSCARWRACPSAAARSGASAAPWGCPPSAAAGGARSARAAPRKPSGALSCRSTRAPSPGSVPAAAGSPQAKGRIERFWQTLQDRLVAELRLRGIDTLDGANAFFPEFLADLTARFARAPAQAAPAWRPPPRDLAALLSCRYTRVVA